MVYAKIEYRAFLIFGHASNFDYVAEYQNYSMFNSKGMRIWAPFISESFLYC
jgi:hypothetical protein